LAMRWFNSFLLNLILRLPVLLLVWSLVVKSGSPQACSYVSCW
jgi:hypothetical protein